MNFGEMIERVQKLFGDTSEAVIDLPFIRQMLNDGQMDVARQTKVLQRRAQTDVVADQAEYSLPTDFISIERVTFEGKKLEATTMAALDLINRDRDADSDSGDPLYYYTWGRTVWLYPTPDGDSTDGLDIWYIKQPTEMSADDDEPEVPGTYHEDIVRYALARCKESDEEDAKAALILAEYRDRLNVSKDEQFDDNMESYPAVRDIDGGWYG